MTDLDAAWVILAATAKRAIEDSRTREELIAACNSPAYRALRDCEADHFYNQAKQAAQDKADKYAGRRS